LNCENNLILFPQNLKRTPAHSTFKNTLTLEYLLSSPTEAVSGLGKKKMTTKHNNNNATVMAMAIDGDRKSGGGGSGVRRRQPQRWRPKD
jgi:hypothetical protein